MFTLVFDGDLRELPTNPHKTDTPFGRPIAAAIGNGLVDGDTLTDQIGEAREWLEACLGLVEGRGPPNWDGIRDFLRRTDR
jgi:hypothetical protein